jgi:tellurite resistance protein TerC
MSMKNAMTQFTWLRRAIVAVIGFTILVIGVAMIVFPGPAIVFIPLGLGILATEFVWARRWLVRARATIAHKRTVPLTGTHRIGRTNMNASRP